jgi:hypothetical protein
MVRDFISQANFKIVFNYYFKIKETKTIRTNKTCFLIIFFILKK